MNKRQLQDNCLKQGDGTMFMKLIFLSGTLTTFLARNSFAQPYIAEIDTAVASVEPETGRQDDSSAIVTDVRAGVDVRLSLQGHEESEWDGGSEECVFCFCSPCVTSVRQQWLRCEQDARKRNSGIRKKLDRKFWSMLNKRGAWRHPYTFIKR